MPNSPNAVGHVVICCRVPEDASELETARWRAEASSRGVAVTWCVAPDDVERWLEATGSGRTLAVCVGNAASEAELGRDEIRDALRQRLVSAAVVEGDRPIDHRRLFVEGGVDVVATERLHPVDRQSRRPAPQGWDCRCVLWGLWETGYTAPRRRLFGLLDDSRPRAGRLTVIKTGCRPNDRSDVGLSRLRQTLTQLQPSLRSHAVSGCLLADLPARLQGGHTSEDRGSILAAA